MKFEEKFEAYLKENNEKVLSPNLEQITKNRKKLDGENKENLRYTDDVKGRIL